MRCNITREVMLNSLINADYRPGTRGFYLAALAAFTFAYALVLWFTGGGGLLRWLSNILANVAPLLITAIPARLVILRLIDPLSPLPRFFAHIATALVFAASWFFLLMVFLGFFSGDGFMSFSVRPFLGPAATWQMLQGATFYALIALAAYCENVGGEVESAASEPAAVGARQERLFVRDGDEMRPLDPERVVVIAAAGDYAEVVTRSGRHLLRTTLAELEKNLGPAFLRVHRSTIVNIDHVERVEPAGGGRLTVHLANGSHVIASRSGARAIRERAL